MKSISRVPLVYEQRANQCRTKAEWQLRAQLLRETPIAAFIGTATQNQTRKRSANPWEGNVLQNVIITDWIHPLCPSDVVPTRADFSLSQPTIRKLSGAALDTFDLSWPTEGGLLVTSDAKATLPYIWRQKVFQRFLLQGGSVWCLAYAEYLLQNCKSHPAAPTFADVLLGRSQTSLDDLRVKGSAGNKASSLLNTEKIAPLMHKIFVSQLTAASTKLMLLGMLQRMQMILATTEMEASGIFLDTERLDAERASVLAKERTTAEKLKETAPSFIRDSSNELHWAKPSHLRFALFGSPSPWMEDRNRGRTIALPKELSIGKLAVTLAANLAFAASSCSNERLAYLRPYDGGQASAVPAIVYASLEVVPTDETTWTLSSLHLWSSKLQRGVRVQGDLAEENIRALAELFRALLPSAENRNLLFVTSCPPFALERTFRNELFGSDEFIEAIGGDVRLVFANVRPIMSTINVEAQQLAPPNFIFEEDPDSEPKYDEFGLVVQKAHVETLIGECNRAEDLQADVRRVITPVNLQRFTEIELSGEVIRQKLRDVAGDASESDAALLAALGLSVLLIQPDAFAQPKLQSMCDLEREDAAMLAGLRITDRTSHGLLAGMLAKHSGSVVSETFLVELARHEPELAKDVEAIAELHEAKQSLTSTLFTSTHSDSVIRARFNHNGTATGRLSATSPNVFSIPSSSHIRNLFCSRFKSNGKMIELDYSQLELVVMAWLAGDDALTADFQKGIDFHSRRVTFLRKSLSYDEVVAGKRDQDPVILRLRKQAKVYSFQSIYGASMSAIADATGLSVEEVKQIRREELVAYPGLEALYAHVNMLAGSGSNGFRVIPLPTGLRVEIAVDKARMSLGGYDPKIKNYPVQAAAAELVQLAIGVLWREIIQKPEWAGRVFLVNTVHDSVWIDCEAQIAHDVAELGIRVLEAIPSHIEAMWPELTCNLPFPVDVSMGPHLGEMTPLVVHRAVDGK